MDLCMLFCLGWLLLAAAILIWFFAAGSINEAEENQSRREYLDRLRKEGDKNGH